MAMGVPAMFGETRGASAGLNKLGSEVGQVWNGGLVLRTRRSPCRGSPRNKDTPSFWQVFHQAQDTTPPAIPAMSLRGSTADLARSSLQQQDVTFSDPVGVQRDLGAVDTRSSFTCWRANRASSRVGRRTRSTLKDPINLVGGSALDQVGFEVPSATTLTAIPCPRHDEAIHNRKPLRMCWAPPAPVRKRFIINLAPRTRSSSRAAGTGFCSGHVLLPSRFAPKRGDR